LILPLSNPIRLMARPFRVYGELADAPDPPSLVLGALRFMFVVGAFVAITATGRFAPVELVTAMVSFTWLPIVHAIGMATSVRLFAPSIPFKRAYALYLEGVGPWVLVLLIFMGSCLFAPQPARPVLMLFVPLVVIGTVWSVTLTFALFRAALKLGRVRAVAATFIFYVMLHILILGYYFAVGQLWPIRTW
jgi:hypothetical protein